MKLTVPALLAGEYNPLKVTLNDIGEFIEAQGIDYTIGPDATKVDILNDLCDALESALTEPETPTEPEKQGESPIIDAERAEVSDPSVPPFLVRRKDRIEAAQRRGGHSPSGNGGKPSETAFMKRRQGGKA